MFTQCPHCQTLFEVDAALLAPAQGLLCCGACGREFDALHRFGERVDALAVERRPAAPPRVEPAIDPNQADLFAPAAGPSSVDARRERPVEPPVPDFSRRRVSHGGRGNGRWLFAALLLTLSLAVQIVFAQRDELAADPRWRAWLEPVCARLGCNLPAWRDTDRLVLAARSIGPHPTVDGALMVTATMQNDAPWPQAWPLLELTLSDLDGRPVALRRFTADEYLGGPPPTPTLAPGQSALAQLELADPGKQAVAFAFDFH
jgi:predicted Zn finger-like uncharacterized protein